MLERETPVGDPIVFEVVGLEKTRSIKTPVRINRQGVANLEQQVVARIKNVIDEVFGELGIGVSRCDPALQ